MLDIRLPFAGFYESIHSHAIDEAVTKHTCWLLKQTSAYKYTDIPEILEFDGETPPDAIRTIVSDLIDYDAVFDGICKKFVDYFNKKVGLADLGISVTFRGVWSPREYNVHTNQITCQISESDFQKLFDRMVVTDEAFTIVLKQLESRPGFVSHWPSDKEWWFNNIANIEDNQKYILGYLCLQALALDSDGLSSTWEQGIWEAMEGNDEYGNSVNGFCNNIQAAFKIGMFVQEKSTTGVI